MAILGRGDWPSRDLGTGEVGLRGPVDVVGCRLAALCAGPGGSAPGLAALALQVAASVQVPSRRVRPRLMRLRRFRAAVRRLSQALLAATPR